MAWIGVIGGGASESPPRSCKCVCRCEGPAATSEAVSEVDRSGEGGAFASVPDEPWSGGGSAVADQESRVGVASVIASTLAFRQPGATVLRTIPPPPPPRARRRGSEAWVVAPSAIIGEASVPKGGSFPPRLVLPHATVERDLPYLDASLGEDTEDLPTVGRLPSDGTSPVREQVVDVATLAPPDTAGRRLELPARSIEVMAPPHSGAFDRAGALFGPNAGIGSDGRPSTDDGFERAGSHREVEIPAATPRSCFATEEPEWLGLRAREAGIVVPVQTAAHRAWVESEGMSAGWLPEDTLSDAPDAGPPPFEGGPESPHLEEIRSFPTTPLDPPGAGEELGPLSAEFSVAQESEAVQPGWGGPRGEVLTPPSNPGAVVPGTPRTPTRAAVSPPQGAFGEGTRAARLAATASDREFVGPPGTDETEAEGPSPAGAEGHVPQIKSPDRVGAADALASVPRVATRRGGGRGGLAALAQQGERVRQSTPAVVLFGAPDPSYVALMVEAAKFEAAKEAAAANFSNREQFEKLFAEEEARQDQQRTWEEKRQENRDKKTRNLDATKVARAAATTARNARDTATAVRAAVTQLRGKADPKKLGAAKKAAKAARKAAKAAARAARAAKRGGRSGGTTAAVAAGAMAAAAAKRAAEAAAEAARKLAEAAEGGGENEDAPTPPGPEPETDPWAGMVTPGAAVPFGVYPNCGPEPCEGICNPACTGEERCVCHWEAGNPIGEGPVPPTPPSGGGGHRYATPPVDGGSRGGPGPLDQGGVVSPPDTGGRAGIVRWTGPVLAAPQQAPAAAAPPPPPEPGVKLTYDPRWDETTRKAKTESFLNRLNDDLHRGGMHLDKAFALDNDNLKLYQTDADGKPDLSKPIPADTKLWKQDKQLYEMVRFLNNLDKNDKPLNMKIMLVSDGYKLTNARGKKDAVTLSTAFDQRTCYVNVDAVEAYGRIDPPPWTGLSRDPYNMVANVYQELKVGDLMNSGQSYEAADYDAHGPQNKLRASLKVPTFPQWKDSKGRTVYDPGHFIGYEDEWNEKRPQHALWKWVERDDDGMVVSEVVMFVLNNGDASLGDVVSMSPAQYALLNAAPLMAESLLNLSWLRFGR